MSTKKETPAKPRGRFGGLSFQRIQQAIILLLTLSLCAVSAVQIDTFLTVDNIVGNLLRNAAAWGIVACGMTLVMVGGGFDLSVASTTAVCSVVMVLTLRGLEPYGPTLAISAALAVTVLVGVALGAVNGLLVAYVGVNPFVATLSTMLIFRGLALVFSGGGQSLTVPLSMQKPLGTFFWGSVGVAGVGEFRMPFPILLFLVVFACGLYALRFTRLGHYVYALGGNENAAWLAGVNTRAVKAATYVICGLTCAVAATILMAMTTTAEASSFQGAELLVIACVIVGGTPLGGGSGGMTATLVGILLLRVIENLLTQYGITAEYQNILRGAIIVTVVAVDVLVRRRKGA